MEDRGNMKIIIKKLIIVICVVISIMGTYYLISKNKDNKVVKQIDALTIDSNRMPSIDFVQPYLLDDDFDYDTYFNELISIGYDTIIVQMTRSEETDGTSTFFYDTKIEDSDLNVTKSDLSNNVLSTLVEECEKHNFDYYIGLSVEEYSWWALTCYYDETYMKHCADVDSYMVQELYDLYGQNEHFIGWYFAYELFSNPIGWEKYWVKNVNQVIDTVLKVDQKQRPIMFSPFRQIQLGLITNEYHMWKRFFELSHLRTGIDIMCPQDSIGKLDNTNDPHTPCTNRSYRLVYNYIDDVAKATKDAGLKFYVNCELFRAYKGDSAYLFLGDIERVTKQIKNGQRYAEKLVTFSASHYLLSQGDQEDEISRQKYFEDYKTLYDGKQ